MRAAEERGKCQVLTTTTTHELPTKALLARTLAVLLGVHGTLVQPTTELTTTGFASSTSTSASLITTGYPTRLAYRTLMLVRNQSIVQAAAAAAHLHQAFLPLLQLTGHGSDSSLLLSKGGGLTDNTAPSSLQVTSPAQHHSGPAPPSHRTSRKANQAAGDSLAHGR